MLTMGVLKIETLFFYKSNLTIFTQNREQGEPLFILILSEGHQMFWPLWLYKEDAWIINILII